jgi:hypothetical protein
MVSRLESHEGYLNIDLFLCRTAFRLTLQRTEGMNLVKLEAELRRQYVNTREI